MCDTEITMVTTERLQELFLLDKNGELIWKVDKGTAKKAL